MHSLFLQVRIDVNTFTYVTAFQGLGNAAPILQDATTPQTKAFPGPESFGIPIALTK